MFVNLWPIRQNLSNPSIPRETFYDIFRMSSHAINLQIYRHRFCPEGDVLVHLVRLWSLIRRTQALSWETHQFDIRKYEYLILDSWLWKA